MKTILDLGSAGARVMKPGDVVLIQALDALPKHVFRMSGHCSASQALTRPLQGERASLQQQAVYQPRSSGSRVAGEEPVQDERDFSASWIDFGLL